MTIVVDASVALAWCLPGEGTPRTGAILDRVVARGALVASTWPLEVANIILLSERNGRIQEAEAAGSLAMLAQLVIEVDSVRMPEAFLRLVDLARWHALTVYDASYLEVAIRRQLPLATDDGPMRQAAIDAGIEVL